MFAVWKNSYDYPVKQSLIQPSKLAFYILLLKTSLSVSHQEWGSIAHAMGVPTLIPHQHLSSEECPKSGFAFLPCPHSKMQFWN